uniref:Skp1-related protein n=1 Tax=Ditylenchus dipsaci TaxID=166011 RepID=A0A915CRV6_9BILA
MDQSCVSCKTLEEEIIQVPWDVMRQSKTFDEMYCNLGAKDLIVEEYYATKDRIWFELTNYQKNFLGVPVDELVQLISAANYLDVKSLTQLGCQCLAQLMKEKTSEEVRDLFGISNDLTEEEVQEIKKQNVWCD